MPPTRDCCSTDALLATIVLRRYPRLELNGGKAGRGSEKRFRLSQPGQLKVLRLGASYFLIDWLVSGL